jgi:long-chain acyl-CoA synthetase
MQNLLGQLKHWNKLTPSKPFIYDGDVMFTFAEAYERAFRFAGGLKKLGLKKGARIAPIMFNGFRWYDLYYGLSAGGYVNIPLNYRLAGPEMAYQINDSKAEVVIMDPEFYETISYIKDQIPEVNHFIYTGQEQPFGGAIPYDSLLEAEPYECPEKNENDLFGIYYTGGTTGLAKGVMLTHKNIISNAFHLVAAMRLGSDQLALHSAPMFHLADGAVNFAITLAGGGHVLVKAFEPNAVLKAIERYKPTCSLFVPTMVNMLVNQPDIKNFDLSSLQYIFYGASPISPNLLRNAKEVFNCDFVQVYGMTEASPILTILLPEEHKQGLSDESMQHLLKAAGRQIIGVEVRVVDKEGKDVRPGEVGEIIAYGDNIMQGYWNKPEETAAALIDGWYWTKDLATIDEDHYVYMVDRAKDMIITGGENVYSVEVEDTLMGHPDILEAAVIGVPHEEWGETILAVVALKPNAAKDEAALREFCKQRIAGYKVPKKIEFVDALPKTGAGKILKKELREKYWEGIERRIG